jgi:phosphatidylserine/phosphatidylglycerophosphate/cardiolipin synthase-like enzyme
VARLHVAAWWLAAALWSMPLLALEPSQNVPATGTIEFAFSPQDDVAKRVVQAIDGARSQVLVQAFAFTHDGIAEALVRADGRGLDVGVIADAGQSGLLDRSVIPKLSDAGLEVFLDGEHLAAHNKVVVIDADGTHPVVLTGSFNFTFAAQYRNAENLLILRGNRELAKAYRDNWMRHRAHSTPFAQQPIQRR